MGAAARVSKESFLDFWNSELKDASTTGRIFRCGPILQPGPLFLVFFFLFLGPLGLLLGLPLGPLDVPLAASPMLWTAL